MGEHWDTWCAHGSTDQKMPTQWHSQGMPVYWTGETWFQVARPREFKCEKTGKFCTWVMGRKTEMRKNSMRPYDMLPELWYLLSYDEREKHYQRWSTHRQPAIAAAEIARKRNGLDIVRNDDDLDRGAKPFKAGGGSF